LRTLADVCLSIAGVALILVALNSAVRSTILPRAAPNRLARASGNAVRGAFRLWVGRSASYERRDRIMAMLGPVSLLALLTTWLVVVLAGYTLIYLAITTRSLARAIELSGSSMFTLGTTSSTRLAANLVSYTEAAVGLLLLTLLITYLPSIYGAFSRREAGVSLLRVRAGVPPRAAELMIRYHRIEDAQYRLSDLWQYWESWFVDVEESHTTFPILASFRSPQRDQSWVTAAGALLDSAAVWVAAVEHAIDRDAQLCIRAGFQALQRIGSVFALPFDPDPKPDDPITITRDEFEATLKEMADAGVPLIADRDQAWRAWKGWRVNYDTVLLNLARLVEAPPAPWVSDRSPITREQTGSRRPGLGARAALRRRDDHIDPRHP
jgi:hypothetical protein